MNLDLNTLFLVTVCVEAMLGLLLLFVWIQNTAIAAVAWWGFAHLLRAASMTMFGLYGAVSDLISVDLANAALFTAFALTWTGARVFGRRPPQPILLFGGAVFWLVVCRVPALASALEMRVLVSSGLITAYTWAAAYEFWRGRAECLVSRWPAIFLLFAHGALYLLHSPFAPLSVDNHVFASVWLTALSFEALLFTIAIAFVLLAMAKERTEHDHKTASLVDPLTGIANRRAFLHDGERVLRPRLGHPRPIAVMLFDLDNFKLINDRFGHAAGDRVLEIFAEVTRGCIRQIDLFGRIGGEEFAALLRDTTREGALALAERVRLAFAGAARAVENRPIGATVSIGIVVSRDSTFDLAALLAQADRALYLAKEAGRNRVEIASIELGLDRGKHNLADRILKIAGRSLPVRSGVRSAA